MQALRQRGVVRRHRRNFSTGLRAALLSELSSQGVGVASLGSSIGRGLVVSAASFSVGDVVLTEASPLAAAGDPAAIDVSCAFCFRALSADAVVLCADCGARYCSETCRVAAVATNGHEAICRGETQLDEWCRSSGHNFPRVAANAVARSLTGGRDFSDYWSRMNALVFATPPPTDALPRAFTEGYSLVKGAFLKAGRLSGTGVNAFFDNIFNLRAYARLMGTFRLNSFSVNPSGSATASVARALSTASSGSACGGDDANANGNCSDGTSASCSPGGSCGESPSGLGDAPGGTAVYEAASLANHECEPSCDVVIAAGGSLALRARRRMAVGDHVTITYLDSSLPVQLRRRKLLLGYGFDCNCTLCQRQLKSSG
jgi:hypothetical protein